MVLCDTKGRVWGSIYYLCQRQLVLAGVEVLARSDLYYLGSWSIFVSRRYIDAAYGGGGIQRYVYTKCRVYMYIYY